MKSNEDTIKSLETRKRMLVASGVIWGLLFCISVFGLPAWRVPVFHGFASLASFIASRFVAEKILRLKSMTEDCNRQA